MVNRWVWAVVAVVLAVCLVACSKNDEPEPTPTPDTEQEDPNTDQGDPNTNQGDQDSEPVENWEDEKPHGFYFDLDSIILPLNEEGFLRFKDSRGYHDSIVIEKKYGYPSKDRSKGGAYAGVANFSSLSLTGKRATPWTNVDKYIELWRSVQFRPNSKFSNFPELADLPVRDISRHGMLTLETLVEMDIISHNYFNKDIPAGGSMRGVYHEDDLHHPVGMLYGIVDNEYFLGVIRAGYTSFEHSPERRYRYVEGELKLVIPSMSLMLQGYPEKAGDYPMTLRMKFANGKVLTRDFKIRFVNEE